VTIQTATMKNALADAYKATAINGAVYTTVPGGTAGTEPSGGSPAYARKVIVWGTSANGVVVATGLPFDIPAGNTIQGFGVHGNPLASGAYLDGTSITSQAFSSQGTYTVTPTYTQT
jgi:hypothetical protein